MTKAKEINEIWNMKASFLLTPKTMKKTTVPQKLSSRLTEKLSSKLYGDNCRLHY